MLELSRSCWQEKLTLLLLLDHLRAGMSRAVKFFGWRSLIALLYRPYVLSVRVEVAAMGGTCGRDAQAESLIAQFLTAPLPLLSLAANILPSSRLPDRSGLGNARIVTAAGSPFYTEMSGILPILRLDPADTRTWTLRNRNRPARQLEACTRGCINQSRCFPLTKYSNSAAFSINGALPGRCAPAPVRSREGHAKRGSI